ncbi:MAG: HEAT repeat domain-containing protein, partial [Lentisphaerae bacterium]|nr:HEAT repeat domain-containing protein [Lentisphaerota bacterium]
MKRDLFRVASAIAISLLSACRTTTGPEGSQTPNAPSPFKRPGQKALQEAFSGLRSYEFGQSRAGLVTIERETAHCRPASGRQQALEAGFLALLTEGTASVSARRFACRQLSLVGTKASVPTLSGLLGDAQLGEIARYALERIPGSDADEAFREAIERLVGPARIGVVNSMGKRGQRGAVPTLAKLVGSPDGELREAVLGALGRIGTADAAATLARQRDLTASVWLGAWLECANRLADTGELEEAAGMFDDLFGGDVPSHVRGAALDGLVRTRREGVVPIVVSLLADSDPAVRIVAAEYVRDMPGERSTETFARELSGLGPEGKAVLVMALGDRGDAAARDHVIRLLKDDDANVREAAVRALGKLGNSNSVELLAQLLRGGGDGALANVARESLIELRADGVDQALTSLLENEDGDVVTLVAGVLAERGISAARSELFSLCGGDRPVGVRKAAVAALEELAEPSDVRRLIHLIEAPENKLLRSALQDALVAACRRTTPESRAIRRVQRAYRRGESAVQVCLLHVLGRLGTQESLRTVTSAFYGPDSALRNAAIRLLGGWPDASCDDVLAHIAETTSDDIHRVLAVRGLVRALALESDLSDADKLALIRRGMSAAKRPEDRKLVLSALGQVDSLGALEMCGEWIGDPELGEESGVAAETIVEAIKGTQRTACEVLLERFLLAPLPTAARSRLEATLENLRKYDDYLRWWQFCGPYTKGKNKASALFAEPFSPEDPKQAEAVSWKLRTPSANAFDSWFVNFAKLLGGSNRVAYARTWVWVPSERDARLEFGSDDGAKVWLNGVLVHSKDTSRALRAGEDTVEVKLTSGWNALVVKVRQGGGDWAVAARLRMTDGTKMANLCEFGSGEALNVCRQSLLGSDSDLWPEALEMLTQHPDTSGALDVLLAGASGKGATAVVDAAIALAGRAVGPEREQCESLLRSLQREMAPGKQRERIQDALYETTKLDDHVMLWEIAGPFSAAATDSPPLYTAPFPPEPGENGKRVRWTLLDSRKSPSKAWEVDLNKALGTGSQCVAYMRTRVWVEDGISVRMELGSDDGVKVWLNDVVAHEHDVARPVRVAEDRVDVQLARGWNDVIKP